MRSSKGRESSNKANDQKQPRKGNEAEAQSLSRSHATARKGRSHVKIGDGTVTTINPKPLSEQEEQGRVNS
jgi:hypothetical protein